MEKYILLSLALLLFAGGAAYSLTHPTRTTPMSQDGTMPPVHQIWDELLNKHVDPEGWVDYQAFQRDHQRLEQYLKLLSQNPPANSWSEAEKLTYWINAYNAFTVKLIVDHYPLKSIRDLHTLPGIATIWHEEFFEIGGQPTSLDQIEHDILRKEFNEPRIHFAINCASVSCPILRNEAFLAHKLDSQLSEQARRFLSQPIRNQIQPNQIALSKIFKWFQADFIKDQSLIEFLNQYSPVQIHPDASISYLEYDWTLNESPDAMHPNN